MISIILMLIIPKALIAEDIVPLELQTRTYSKNELVQKVYHYAKIHKNNPEIMIRTINCENDTWDIERQSELKYKKGNRWGFSAGIYEKSYGLAMIHLPDHPYITREQATDPDFAIDYMAEHLGRDVTWSCYKKAR